ncbi:MAG: hypothetical protein K8M05_09495 [Deltaproteobacteria bacterium]|nr:hypothetical protein [Kofleriaceae bacterium]
MLRYLFLAVAACCGVACIAVGLGLIGPPEQGHGEMGMYYAVGDAYGRSIGWALIIFGGLILGCSALGAFVLVLRAKRTPATVRASDAAASLPEARAHVVPTSKGTGSERKPS